MRTWCLRGTLHLLATADLGWLLALLGPGLIAAGRGRRADLGLDEQTSARGLGLLQVVLSGQGPLSRAVLVEKLAAHGLPLHGQAVPHLLGLAALQGLICLGPEQGSKATYVLLAEWADPGPALPREAALARLALRYLAAYGPATPEDLAAWASLPIGEARRAWEAISSELVELRFTGSPLWMLPSRAAWLDEPLPPGPSVRLLPAFDTYLLGYRTRDLTVEPRHFQQVNAGGGIIHPTVLFDGRAGGSWRINRRKASLEVVAEPYKVFPPGIRPGLEAEVASLGQYFGVPAKLILT